MKPKKILFLAHYYLPHVGGVEKHVEHISSFLTEKGYEVTIVTWQHDNKLPLTQKERNLTVLRIPYQFHEKKIQTWIWMLKHVQLFLQADIVHVHDIFWWMLPLAPFLIHKTFMTFHGYEGSEAPHFRQRLQHKIADFLTHGSIGIGGFHEKWYGVKPTVTSFGAIEAKIKGKKQKGKRTAVYIGRLAEDVGIMTYLEFIKLLKEKGKHVSLDVYGDGPLRKKAEQFVKKYSLPVYFKGFVRDASSVLSNYSYAFVSRHLAILEALSLGIPVLAEYNNQIKKDYLQLSPFSKWIMIGHLVEDFLKVFSPKFVIDSKAEEWAKQQTWEKLVGEYEKLWGQ